MAQERMATCVRVRNVSKDTALGGSIRVARSFWSRGRGLMFKRDLPRDSGLLIDPCSSIHTLWMRFPIDVVHVRRDNIVSRVDHAMPPWRLGSIRTGGKFVIELPAGVAGASRTEPGDQLEIEPVG